MPLEVGFETLKPDLERLKQDPSPLTRWTVACIEELYFGGNIALARLKGPASFDIKYAPRAVRLIGLHRSPEGIEVKGVSVPFYPRSDEEALRFGERLRDGVRQLPSTGQAPGLQMEFAQAAVASSGKLVLAALEVAQTTTDLDQEPDIMQILYPKTYIVALRQMFASLGRPITELQARTMSYGVASMFLKTSRFTSEKPFMIRREDREQP